MNMLRSAFKLSERRQTKPKDRDKVLQFVSETKVNFPIWMGATSADMIRFGLGTALPGTVIIDREGRVAKVISGVINQAELKKQIEAMLAQLQREQARSKPNETEVSSVPS